MPGSPFAADDLVVSVARDLAQAAMVRDGITAATSALTADAEHAALRGDLQAAIAKLSQVALTSVDARTAASAAPCRRRCR